MAQKADQKKQAEQRAVIEAVSHGDKDTMEAMFDASPGLASVRNSDGVSVVALAVYAGQRELAAALARGRDDLDLFEASCVGDVKRVGELVRDHSELIDEFSPDGFTPLGYSAFFGYLGLLQYLIVRGAEVNLRSKNEMQVTPLHSAVANFDQELAPRLAEPLLTAGADVNARQEGGFTPLHEAAYNGNLDLIELLLSRGADATARTDEGDTPAGLARKQGHHHGARLIDSHGS